MRTNKLFTVTVCKYATMAVEADDVQQAMNIAKKYKDTHLTDRDFADSDIDVYSCEAYGCSLDDMCLKPTDRVYARDEVLTAENYRRELNGKEPLPEPTTAPAAPTQKIEKHKGIDKKYFVQMKEGADPTNPLYDKKVVISGTFEQIEMERDDVAAGIQKLGAQLKHDVCKEMDFFVTGNRIGPAKQKKVEQWRSEGYNIQFITPVEIKEIINKYVK